MATKLNAYHNGRQNEEVEGRPNSIIEEPLVLPEGIESFLGDEIGKESIIDSREDDHDDNHVTKLQEDLQFGCLLLFLQILDCLHQGVQNRKVEERVDQSGRNQIERALRAGSGERGRKGIPQRKRKVPSRRHSDLPTHIPERRARNAESARQKREKASPHNDHNGQTASDGARDHAKQHADERNGGGVAAVVVVMRDVEKSQRLVDEERSQHDEDHLVDVHHLLFERDASQTPKQQQPKTQNHEEFGEGDQAIQASREVAVGIHHGDASSDIQVCSRCVTKGEQHVILAFGRNIIMEPDRVAHSVSRLRERKERIRYGKLQLSIHLFHSLRNDKAV